MVSPGGSDQDPIDIESVERFLRLAVQAGTINGGTALRLSELARALGAPPAVAPAPPPPPPCLRLPRW